MAVDITSINRLVFGVNFLGEHGGKTVNTLWKNRFSGREAFLVTTDPQTNPKEIFDKFCQMLEKQEQTHMVGQECMLVYFMDYTADIPKTAENAIWGMRKVMEAKLNCNIQAVIQFAFVGQRGQRSVVQKENIKKALANNGKKKPHENYRLLLVGESVLTRNVDYNWKSAVVFTDLLRRCKVVSNYLPVSGGLGTNDIGFLRYGEFNQARYQRLQEEYRRLQEQLSNAKQDGLRALVEKKREELIEQLEMQFPINGACHPQHPDMIVPEKNRWFDPDLRREAARDNNQTYNQAVKATRAAVEETGRSIRRRIEEIYEQHIKDAPKSLNALFEASNAGIMLKLDPVSMQGALYMQPYYVSGTVPKLTFKYSVQGVQDEIQAYLEYIKKNSIAAGLERYAKALSQAYQDIPRETFEAQKQVLQRECNMAAEQVEKEMSAEEFCHWVSRNYPPEYDFSITNEMNVGNRKFLLGRFSYTELLDAADHMGTIGAHVINDYLSGMVSFDEAPIKAVMVEAVECKDWVLDHFLPEVEWDSDQEQAEEDDEFAF